MKIEVFQTVNAGLFLSLGGCGLMIDGLHQGKEIGFSSAPAELLRQMETGQGLFRHLTGLLFTHLHPDHYDGGYVGTALQNDPDLLLYGPELSQTNIKARDVRQGVRHFRMGSADILAVDTLHDGACFQAVPHNSFLIRMGGECLFIAGDAALQPEEAGLFCEFYGTRIEGAFMNLYQIVSPEGQEFLRRLAPRRLFLYHLPLPEDDRYQVILQARQRLKRLPAGLPPAEVSEALSWLDGRAPDWAAECWNEKANRTFLTPHERIHNNGKID